MKNNTAKKKSGNGKSSSGTSDKLERSFTLKEINGKEIKEGGRFVSLTPKSAASKMFTRWCRDNKKKGECIATITLVETTRGSNDNEYRYNAIRRVQEHSMEHNGVQITHKYLNVLYSTKKLKSIKK